MANMDMVVSGAFVIFLVCYGIFFVSFMVINEIKLHKNQTAAWKEYALKNEEYLNESQALANEYREAILAMFYDYEELVSLYSQLAIRPEEMLNEEDTLKRFRKTSYFTRPLKSTDEKRDEK